MAHPFSSTYLDQQAARILAILPAAGVFDATPVEMACPGFDFVTLFIIYTRGGAAGSVRLRPEFSPDSTGTVWYQKSLYAPAVLAAGVDAASLEQRESVLYTATGVAADLFVLGPIELNGTVERLRVPCAEVGNVGAPGTCVIRADFASRSASGD